MRGRRPAGAGWPCHAFRKTIVVEESGMSEERTGRGCAPLRVAAKRRRLFLDGSFGANAIHVVQGAEEKLSARDGWRSVTLFLQLVLADHLELVARLQHEHDAVVVQEIQMTVRQHRRGA